MGFRFQKRLNILPGVRINLSKRGASASLGPRGADVNIGSHGVSTNAGIPGTGLSYRQKLGGKTGSGLIGVVALVAGLGFAAYKNADKIGALFTPASAPVVQPAIRHRAATAAAVPAADAEPPQAPAPKPARLGIRAQAAKLLVPGHIIYVRRQGSVLRETEKSSGTTLKKLDKGAAVTVIALDDGWTQVKDGETVGWMRTSVLGPKP